MRITLRSYTVSNFQAIGTSDVYHPTPGLWSILGINEDEGGSNGSGKSSYARGIIVGLLGIDYIDVTLKELKNRAADEKPVIKLDLLVDDKELLIDRTIGGRLIAFFDGKELEGKNEEVQIKILEALKLTDEQLNYLTNKPQGSFGGFLMMNDKAKKEFLGSFFNIKKLEAAADKISEDLSAKITESEKLMVDITMIRSRSFDFDKSISDINARIAERASAEFTAQEILTRTRVLELENEKTAIKAKLNAIDNNSSNLMPESPMYIKMLESSERLDVANKDTRHAMYGLNSRLQEIATAMSVKPVVPADMTSTLGLIDSAIKNFHAVMNEKSSLNAALVQKQKEIANSKVSINSMKPDTCTTCGQAISAHLFEQLRSKAIESCNMLDTEREKMQVRFSEISNFCSGSEIVGMTKARDEAVAAIEQFKKSFDTTTLQAERTEIEQKVRGVESVAHSAKREYDALWSSVVEYATNTLMTMKNRLTEIDSGLDSLNRLVKERADKLELLKSDLKSLENHRYKLVQELQQLESKHAECMVEVSVLSHSSKVLSRSGFLGSVFDSILNELNHELNKNLKSIPVSAKFSLNFTPDKVIKTTKAITKDISYKLMSGIKEVSFDSCCGGEKLSIIVSVDEALDYVLGKRLGVSVSWKVFDEQFFWIDGHSKEAILDFLRTRNKTYMVIDHAGELNAAIENRIVVTKRDGIATVKICA